MVLPDAYLLRLNEAGSDYYSSYFIEGLHFGCGFADGRGTDDSHPEGVGWGAGCGSGDGYGSGYGANEYSNADGGLCGMGLGSGCGIGIMWGDL